MSSYKGSFYSFYKKQIEYTGERSASFRFRTDRLYTEHGTTENEVPNGHVYYGYLDKLLAQSVNHWKKFKPNLLQKLGIEREYRNKKLSKLSASTKRQNVSLFSRNIFKERYYRYLEQLLHPNSFNALRRSTGLAVQFDYDYLGDMPSVHTYDTSNIEPESKSRIDYPFYETKLQYYLNKEAMSEKRSMFRCMHCTTFEPNSMHSDLKNNKYKLNDTEFFGDHNSYEFPLTNSPDNYRYSQEIYDKQIQFYTVYTPVDHRRLLNRPESFFNHDLTWEKFVMPMHRTCYHSMYSKCPSDQISFPKKMGARCQHSVGSWTERLCSQESCPDKLNTQVHFDHGRDLSLITNSNADPTTMFTASNTLYMYTQQLNRTDPNLHDINARIYDLVRPTARLDSEQLDEFGSPFYTDRDILPTESIIYNPRCFIQCDTCWAQDTNLFDRPRIICATHGARLHLLDHEPRRIDRESSLARIHAYNRPYELNFYYTNNDIKFLRREIPSSIVTHPVKPYFTGNNNASKYWRIHNDPKHPEYYKHTTECSNILTPSGQDYVYKSPSTNTLLFMGMEFETQARDSAVWGSDAQLYKAIVSEDKEKHLFMKRDSTVSGVELCTLPGTIDHWINKFDWNRILRSAKQDGHYASNTSGIHIHASLYGLGLCPMQRAETIEKLFILMDMHYYQLSVIANRIFSSYAKPLFDHREVGIDKHHLDAPVSPLTPEIVKREISNSHDRYKVLNINTGKNTIEFRLFKSTFNYDALISRFQIVHALCDYALNKDIETVLATEWEDLLRHIEKLDHEHLIRYLNTNRVVRDMKRIYMPGEMSCYPCAKHQPVEIPTEKIKISKQIINPVRSK